MKSYGTQTQSARGSGRCFDCFPLDVFVFVWTTPSTKTLRSVSRPSERSWDGTFGEEQACLAIPL